MSHDWTQNDLQRGLSSVGVRPGDTLFTLSNLGYFGIPAGGLTADNAFDTALGALRAAVGPEGTICVPTFTYSFCRGEDFDPASTPSSMGLFPERVRQLPSALRSEDPLFSIAALNSAVTTGSIPNHARHAGRP